MIDHISIAVADIHRARAFYDRALATLGHQRVMDVEDAPDFVGSGYGAREHEPAFWIGAPKPAAPVAPPPEGHHVAFAAPDRAAVDAFHKEALAAGARDNGAPGLRPHYHPDYYAAFVIDPDGHHLEAVCHRPA
jgi:catechol 2,3-dioxygenase-like lactoylglutathione lyase family enzyme